MQLWAGSGLALVSAIASNWAYTLEHDAANRLPSLSARHPLTAARPLISSRPWLVELSLETGGWIVYLAALRLAPLSLVQAIGASGIGAGADPDTRPPEPAEPPAPVAVVLAVVGLFFLALSLIGPHPAYHAPRAGAAALWVGACFAAAAGISFLRIR